MKEERLKRSIAGWAGLAWWILGVGAVRATPSGTDSLAMTMLALGVFGGPISVMYSLVKSEIERGRTEAAEQQKKRDREWARLARSLAPPGAFDGEFLDETIERLLPWGADLSTLPDEPL